MAYNHGFFANKADLFKFNVTNDLKEMLVVLVFSIGWKHSIIIIEASTPLSLTKKERLKISALCIFNYMPDG
jgi:hypothetical protein